MSARRDGLVLREAGPDDDPAIRALLAANFPDNVKARPEFTRWQYWENPFGRTRSWVWDDDGRIVAHWATVPLPIVLDGRAVTGAKGVDGVTDPDYRGRGLFRSLGEALADGCRADGVPVIFSHPNPKAARGVEQAGGRLVARVPVYVLPIDDAWVAARFRLPRPLATAARTVCFRGRRAPPGEELDAPPDGLDGLWADAGAVVRYGIRRDAAWWRWRYAERPERPYRFFAVRDRGRLRGASVSTDVDAFGARFSYVLEFLAVDPAAASGLAQAMVSGAGTAVGAALAGLPGTPVSRMALRAGFRRLPRRLEPHPLRFMVIDCTGTGLADRPWVMAWGDLDHL